MTMSKEDVKVYREAFKKEMHKQMCKVFRNKRNLTTFCKKNGIDLPNVKMDKATLLMYVAEKLTVNEMNKQFNMKDETFLDTYEKMDNEDKMCKHKQYISEGTITKQTNTSTKTNGEEKLKIIKEEEENKQTHKIPVLKREITSAPIPIPGEKKEKGTYDVYVSSPVENDESGEFTVLNSSDFNSSNE